MPTEPQEQAPESCLHHAFHSIGRVGHIARGVSDRRVFLPDGTTVIGQQLAELLCVEPRTVYNWAYASESAPTWTLWPADAPSSGRPPTALGIIDLLIDAVIKDDRRRSGYRSTVWTAPLLQRYLEEAHGIQTSRKSVRRAIAGTGRRKALTNPPRVSVSRSWRCVPMSASDKQRYCQATSGSPT
jgi:hypothetical protein